MLEEENSYDIDLNKDNIIKEWCYIENNKDENKKLDENKKEEKINLNESIMKIINTQNLINGCWDINDKTMIIKEKYEKEFESLKNLKDKNIDVTIAMTIIIIYFINKENSELLNELIMIIKKGKYLFKIKLKKHMKILLKKLILVIKDQYNNYLSKKNNQN